MIDFRFILNPASDAIEIEEPIGWADIAIETERHPRYHGISIAYGVSDLQFTGWAASYLQEQYELHGIDAQVEIEISAGCEGEQWQETFRLDFGQYERACGDSCSVKIGIEQASCFVRFNDGLDKKVDLDASVTFDGATPVPDLPNLRQTVSLPSKTLLKSLEGYMTAGAPPDVVTGSLGYNVGIEHQIRPMFLNTKMEGIKTGQLQSPSVQWTITDPYDSGDDEVVSPFLLYEDDTRCFPGTFNVDMRLAGTVTCKSAEARLNMLEVLFIKATANYFGAIEQLSQYGTVAPEIIAIQRIIPGQVNDISAGVTYSFDLPYVNAAMTIAPGEAIWGLVYAAYGPGNPDDYETTVDWATDTHVLIEAKVNCPASEASLLLPFETIQRVTDIITDGCLRVESTWYGRTDTPVPYGADGCGAFRAITGGLHLRGAPNAKVFLSAKEWFEGMQPVDAIGYALERDEQGSEVLRVEAVEYFYQDIEILRRDNLLGVRIKSNPGETYGTIKIGYDKWQAESVNGLDEFNSTREYRSSVAGARASFEQVSKFIAGGYLIELARIQSFAQTGAADTAHDNDIFLIQLKRGSTGFEVEQGAPQGANIFDPPTTYNFRLSPLRNLLRWWPYVSGMSFRDIYEGLYRFAAGTGNYTAAGLLEDDCSPEEAVLSESETVTADTLKEAYRAALTRAETVTFETTMSLRDFKMLQANPYGYISYQCGTGEWRKGYIQKVTYRPKDGNAAFELRSKYEE